MSEKIRIGSDIWKIPNLAEITKLGFGRTNKHHKRLAMRGLLTIAIIMVGLVGLPEPVRSESNRRGYDVDIVSFNTCSNAFAFAVTEKHMVGYKHWKIEFESPGNSTYLIYDVQKGEILSSGNFTYTKTEYLNFTKKFVTIEIEVDGFIWRYDRKVLLDDNCNHGASYLDDEKEVSIWDKEYVLTRLDLFLRDLKNMILVMLTILFSLGFAFYRRNEVVSKGVKDLA